MKAPSGVAAQALGYWTSGHGRGELRPAPLPAPGPGEALVRTLHTGISRGSESLVHTGQVPEAIASQMRAPFQQGDFGGPVQYGYLSVGVIDALGEAPPAQELPHRWAPSVGQRVFCHFPHQDRYVVPVEALVPVPGDVPSPRAVLGGTVETAINAVWDAAPLWGSRIAVIGAGLVGSSVAAVLRRFPAERLVLVDPAPRGAELAAALGAVWLPPEALEEEFDVVLHCSGTGAGLGLGLSVLGFEGRLVEVSWYGRHAPAVPLGAQFHARRLTIRASQVSAVAPGMRARRTRADRMALALAELREPVYDALITDHSPFGALPQTMQAIAQGRWPGLCHVIDYPAAADEGEPCSH